MTKSDTLNIFRKAHLIRIAVLLFLLSIIPAISVAHQLTVVPAQPNGTSEISIEVSGDWPGNGSPTFQQWKRVDQNIRIDALGVLPGIPFPNEPYQYTVDIGRLPPGQYQAEYFIETFAAPGQPPGAASRSEVPVAVVDFEVEGVTRTEAVPALSKAALFLLGLLLVLTVSGYSASLKTLKNSAVS